MSIYFDKFLGWAESRFDDVIVKGEEILLNSVFCEDRKHHLWCNPSGGKTNSRNGVYHCWKSDSKGSLIGLVMQVDKCSYDEAVETIDGTPEGSIQDLERRVREIFSGSSTASPPPKQGLDLPSDCYLFDELPSYNRLKVMAEEYLSSRKIPTNGLFVCTRGRYRDRVLIPYYDRSGSLIYYNGRYVGDPGEKLRYLGPPKDLGIGKGDVLFCRTWPSKGDKVYITEGEFDSMSLDICGFRSAALGGKSMTERQMEMIKDFIPVLCLDSDSAGGAALPKMANALFSHGFKRVSYVRPCKEYKDWNGMLSNKGERILREYVRTQEKCYNESLGGGDWESTRLAIRNIAN